MSISNIASLFCSAVALKSTEEDQGVSRSSPPFFAVLLQYDIIFYDNIM